MKWKGVRLFYVPIAWGFANSHVALFTMGTTKGTELILSPFFPENWASHCYVNHAP